MSRLGVFGRVLWRVAVAFTAGGAAIAVLVFVYVLFVADDLDGNGLVLAFAAPVTGAYVGLMVSVVAAPVVAALCAWRLVPYPGRGRARRLVRLTGMVLVVLFYVGLTAGLSFELPTVAFVGSLLAVSLLGVWFGLPWVVSWYVRRAEPVT